MKLSHLFKIPAIIIFIIAGLTTSCQNTNNNSVPEEIRLYSKEAEELEAFISVFTNPYIMPEYPDDSGMTLIDFVSIRLAMLEDERLTHNIIDFEDLNRDVNIHEYEIPADLVYEEIYKYFGIEKKYILSKKSQRPKKVILYDDYYGLTPDRYAIGIDAKIKSSTKKGNRLILKGYTVERGGDRIPIPDANYTNNDNSYVNGVYLDIAHYRSDSVGGHRESFDGYYRDYNYKKEKIVVDAYAPLIYEFEAVVAPHEYNGEKTWKLVEFTPIY